MKLDLKPGDICPICEQHRLRYESETLVWCDMCDDGFTVEAPVRSPKQEVMERACEKVLNEKRPTDVELLFIAEDYLRQHWDMDSVPLCYIKERLDKVRSEGKARLADRTLPHKGISARSPDSDRMTSGRGEREPLKSA